MDNILVVGDESSLLIHLAHHFTTKGFGVFLLTQKENLDIENVSKIKCLSELSHTPIHHVFNLTSSSPYKKRWSKKNKAALVADHVRPTISLMTWIQDRKEKPKTVLTTSDVKFYGICPSRKWAKICTENQHPQPFFVSKLYQLKEAAALKYYPQSKIVRLGTVIDGSNGAFSNMINPIKKSMIGHAGNGRHPFNWVHIEDVCNAFEYIITIKMTNTYFNVVAPQILNNKDMVKSIQNHFKKNVLITPPYWLYKIIYGEKSDAIINGQHCEPRALTDNFFEFKYTELDDALKHLYPQKKPKSIINFALSVLQKNSL